MKRSIYFFLAYVLIFLNTSSFASQLMIEPLLGLSYNPESINFIKLDKQTQKYCNEKEIVWIYASHSDAVNLYFVTAGFIDTYKDFGKTKSREPDFGAVYVLNKTTKKCRVLGTPDVVFSGEVNGVSNKLLDALALDARKRYEQAFGGNTGLKQQFIFQNKNIESLDLPLRKAFELKESELKDGRAQ